MVDLFLMCMLESFSESVYLVMLVLVPLLKLAVASPPPFLDLALMKLVPVIELRGDCCVLGDFKWST